MSEKVTELIEELEKLINDPSTEIETGDKISQAIAMLEAMKIAMHSVDAYCNVIRTNYRNGAQEEIIASTVKSKVRDFLR